MSDFYSVVDVDVVSNTMFLTDVDDGSCIAINPDCWGLIKEMVDQQIADGCLDDRDEDYEQITDLKVLVDDYIRQMEFEQEDEASLEEKEVLGVFRRPL